MSLSTIHSLNEKSVTISCS